MMFLSTFCILFEYYSKCNADPQTTFRVRALKQINDSSSSSSFLFQLPPLHGGQPGRQTGEIEKKKTVLRFPALFVQSIQMCSKEITGKNTATDVFFLVFLTLIKLYPILAPPPFFFFRERDWGLLGKVLPWGIRPMDGTRERSVL